MADGRKRDQALAERLIALSAKLMLIPGLAGHEDRVRHAIAAELEDLGPPLRTDRLGNPMLTLDGDQGLPSVMLFAHMDQLGFIVRKIEANGLIRVERLGGVPERALAAQEVLLQVGEGRDLPAVIANKSHHATSPEEKYRVIPYADIFIDAGFSRAEEALAAGVDIGTPVVYAPRAVELAGGRLAGTSIDDRAGCAVVIEVARALAKLKRRPTVHIVFSVQEEFNLRGVVPAVEALAPDIAIQIDLVLATDTPDMVARGDVSLGGGPAMSMYSFHGRGTLNGLIPHPALVRLFSQTAKASGMPLQRSAHTGALTETSYVQLMHRGIACIDMGFPVRYTHSALEVCEAGDLEALTRLLVAAIGRVDKSFTLDRDG
jgi:putative aminopeptidase FrvX